MMVGYEEEPQVQGVIDLRPMDAGDVLDGTIRVYRANPWVLIGIYAVIASVPIYFQQAAGQYFTYVTLRVMQKFADEGIEALNALQTTDFYASLGVMGGALVLSFFVAPLAQAAMVYAVSETILGRAVGVFECIGKILPRAWTIIGAYLLLGLIVLVPYIPIVLFFTMISGDPRLYEEAFALFIPAFILAVFVLLYIWIKLLFIPQAVVLDDVGAVRAFGRSYSLTGGYWWRIFGIYMLVVLIVGIIAGLLEQGVKIADLGFRMVPGMSELGVAASSGVLLTMITLVIQPLTVIATTLLYYDLRVRKEGFDLLVLAASVAGEEPEKVKPFDGVPIG